MRPAAEQFAADIKAINWQAPQIPLIQNVTATAVQDVEALKANLLAQLYSPVRWVETVQYLAEQGVTDLVECGPGRVLGGLNKRCAKELKNHSLDACDAFEAALATLK